MNHEPNDNKMLTLVYDSPEWWRHVGEISRAIDFHRDIIITPAASVSLGEEHP